MINKHHYAEFSYFSVCLYLSLSLSSLSLSLSPVLFQYAYRNKDSP